MFVCPASGWRYAAEPSRLMPPACGGLLASFSERTNISRSRAGSNLLVISSARNGLLTCTKCPGATPANLASFSFTANGKGLALVSFVAATNTSAPGNASRAESYKARCPA